MKKAFLVSLALCAGLAFFAAKSDSQTDEYRTIILSGTADVLIDSTLDSASMANKRVYINGIYAFYDNAANTNPIHLQIVRGTSALRVQGSQRVWRFAELMTSGGLEAYTFTPNVTSGPDSAIYFVINAASSDSLFMAISYKIVGG